MFFINKNIIERILEESKYILSTRSTIRETAKKFEVSKSTVHKDLQERLLQIDEEKHKKVREILQYHTKIRHIRGGVSTKLKFMVKNAN